MNIQKQEDFLINKDEEKNLQNMKIEDPFLRLLRGIKCDSVIFPSMVSIPVTVSSTDTLATAFKSMIDNQVLAVPVINSNSGQVISVFSMLDLLAYITSSFTEEDFKGLASEDSETWHYFYSKLLGTKDHLANERLDNVFGKKLFEFENLDPLITVYSDFPLQTAIELMIGSKSHRVVVLDKETGQFSNFISQSRIIELLVKLMPDLPNYYNLSITDLLLQKGASHVDTVREDEMALNAFKKMVEKKVSGLGVVNDKGELVGNISISDLKLLEFDLTFFALLGSSVKDYLRDISRQDLLHQKPVRFQALREALASLPKPVVTCKMADRLGIVMSIIKHYKIHRIFVIDEKEHPTVVISLHDILSFIMNFHYKTSESL